MNLRLEVFHDLKQIGAPLYAVDGKTDNAGLKRSCNRAALISESRVDFVDFYQTVECREGQVHSTNLAMLRA